LIDFIKGKEVKSNSESKRTIRNLCEELGLLSTTGEFKMVGKSLVENTDTRKYLDNPSFIIDE